LRALRTHSAGDDDCSQKHRELTQHADGDEVHHEDFGAEALQLLRAHVRDDDADEEPDQRDDRNRRDARVIHMAGDGDRPQPLRLEHRPRGGRDDAAGKIEGGDHVTPATDDLAPECFDGLDPASVFARRWAIGCAREAVRDDPQLLGLATFEGDLAVKLPDPLDELAQAPGGGKIQHGQMRRVEVNVAHAGEVDATERPVHFGKSRDPPFA